MWYWNGPNVFFIKRKVITFQEIFVVDARINFVYYLLTNNMEQSPSWEVNP